eukprot:2989538-Pyramimonas_sp.AAC.1
MSVLYVTPFGLRPASTIAISTDCARAHSLQQPPTKQIRTSIAPSLAGEFAPLAGESSQSRLFVYRNMFY